MTDKVKESGGFVQQETTV